MGPTVSGSLAVLRNNPGFLPRLVKKCGPIQLARGVWVSLQHADSVAGVVPGRNTTLAIDGGSIEPNGHVVIGTAGPPYLRDRKTMLAMEGGTFRSTADDILYVGKGTTIYVNGGSLSMGNVRQLYGCEIYCTDRVSIGDECAIGPGVVVRDGHPHTLEVDGEATPSSAPVVIEDGAIIPGQTIVKEGVTVGEGAVVASGSVVTDDVPARSLVAGVPAEVIETDVEWVD